MRITVDLTCIAVKNIHGKVRRVTGKMQSASMKDMCATCSMRCGLYFAGERKREEVQGVHAKKIAVGPLPPPS